MANKLFDLNLEDEELNIDKYFEIKDKEESKGDENPQLVKEKEELNDTVDKEIKENEDKGIYTSSNETDDPSDDDESVENIDDDLEDFDDNFDDEEKDVKEDEEDDKEKEDDVKEEKEEDEKPATESITELTPYQKDLLLSSNVQKVKTELSKLLDWFAVKKESFSILNKTFDERFDVLTVSNKDYEDALPSYLSLANSMLTDKTACPLANTGSLRDIYIQVFSKMKKSLESTGELSLQILSNPNNDYELKTLKKEIRYIFNNNYGLSDISMLPGGYEVSYFNNNVFSPSLNMTTKDLTDVKNLVIEIPYSLELSTIKKTCSYLSKKIEDNIGNLIEEINSIMLLPDTGNNKETFIKLYVSYLRKILIFLKTFISYIELKMTEVSDFFNRFHKYIEVTKKQEQTGEGN